MRRKWGNGGGRPACEGIVGHVEDGYEAGHLLGVYALQYLVGDEEEPGLTMSNDMMDLVGEEIGQYGHNDGSVGDSSHEGYCPAGTVAAAKCNLVAPLDAHLFEQGV